MSILKLLRKVFQRGYKFYAIRANVINGKKLHVGIGTIIWAPNRLVVGNNVYIGKYCTIECNGIIGNDVLIANNVGIIGKYDHDHRSVGISIRNASWIGDRDYKGLGKDLVVHIEDDVWIGYGAIVLAGVRIGRGAIVAAGSVVTSDVEPYNIVVGNPARSVSVRFSDNEIKEHERILFVASTLNNEDST